MIQISHLLVLSQPDFVDRQVRSLLAKEPTATRRARKFFLF
jgi:hypothetical protein